MREQREQDERAQETKYRPIVDTFDRLACKYGGPVGLEEVNRIKLAPLVREQQGMILDVGCGTGTFIEKYLDARRHTVVSVDFSDEMLALTRKRMRRRFGRSVFLIKALAQSLPFADDTFDACVCVNTLHNMPHWADVSDAVAHMARVLRPGGAMLLEFRNIRNPIRRKITNLYDHEHLPQKAFKVEDMIHALHNSGLDVEQRIALYGENPNRNTIMDSAMSGLVGARAPRVALLARKAQPFDELLDGIDDSTP